MSNSYPSDPYSSPSSYDPYQQPGGESYPQYSQSGEPYQPYSQPANPYPSAPPPIYMAPVQPAYVQPMVFVQRQTNGKAITALVLGIVSWVGFSILAGIPAIVFGHIALGEIKASGNTQEGRGMAIAGLVLGYLSLVGILCICLYFLVILRAGTY